MTRPLTIALVPMIALLISAHSAMVPATAQTARGAVGGGIAGAVIGGAVGGGRGAAIGAVVGAGTGAIIGREARRSRGRYYWWHGNCYFHGRNGRWYRVARRYCR